MNSNVSLLANSGRTPKQQAALDKTRPAASPPSRPYRADTFAFTAGLASGLPVGFAFSQPPGGGVTSLAALVGLLGAEGVR